MGEEGVVGTGSNENKLPKEKIGGMLDKSGSSKLRYQDWLLYLDGTSGRSPPEEAKRQRQGEGFGGRATARSGEKPK